MATQTTFTVNDVLTAVADLRGESSVNSDASRIRAVSRANRDFAKRMFWRTHLLRNQTTTGDGTSADFSIGSSTRPMRMKGLCEVYVGGTAEQHRRQIVDYQAYKALYSQNNSEPIAYEWYDASNDLWKMHVNPVPANGDTIYYSYFWEPATLTTTTDSIVCPNMDIIVRLTNSYIYEGDDEEKYKDELVKAEQLISDYIGLENTPAINQTYSFGAIENSVRSRGIGTY